MDLIKPELEGLVYVLPFLWPYFQVTGFSVGNHVETFHYSDFSSTTTTFELDPTAICEQGFAFIIARMAKFTFSPLNSYRLIVSNCVQNWLLCLLRIVVQDDSFS